MSNFPTDGQINALIAGAALWFVNKLSSRTSADATQQSALLKRISDVENNETTKEKQWHEERARLQNMIETLTKERNEWMEKYQTEHANKVQTDMELWKYQNISMGSHEKPPMDNPNC